MGLFEKLLGLKSASEKSAVARTPTTAAPTWEVDFYQAAKDFLTAAGDVNFNLRGRGNISPGISPLCESQSHFAARALARLVGVNSKAAASTIEIASDLCLKTPLRAHFFMESSLKSISGAKALIDNMIQDAENLDKVRVLLQTIIPREIRRISFEIFTSGKIRNALEEVQAPLLSFPGLKRPVYSGEWLMQLGMINLLAFADFDSVKAKSPYAEYLAPAKSFLQEGRLDLARLYLEPLCAINRDLSKTPRIMLGIPGVERGLCAPACTWTAEFQVRLLLEKSKGYELALRRADLLGLASEIAAASEGSEDIGETAQELVSLAEALTRQGPQGTKGLRRALQVHEDAPELASRAMTLGLKYPGFIEAARLVSAQGVAFERVVSFVEAYGDEPALPHGEPKNLASFVIGSAERPSQRQVTAELIASEADILFDDLYQADRELIIRLIVTAHEAQRTLPAYRSLKDQGLNQKARLLLLSAIELKVPDQIAKLKDKVDRITEDDAGKFLNSSDLAAGIRSFLASRIGPRKEAAVEVKTIKNAVPWLDQLEARILAGEKQLPPINLYRQARSALAEQAGPVIRDMFHSYPSGLTALCEFAIKFGQQEAFSFLLANAALRKGLLKSIESVSRFQHKDETERSPSEAVEFERFEEIIELLQLPVDRETFSEMHTVLLEPQADRLRQYSEEFASTQDPLKPNHRVQEPEPLAFSRIKVIGRHYYPVQIEKIMAAAEEVPIEVLDRYQREIAVSGLRQGDLVIFMTRHAGHSYLTTVKGALNGAELRLFRRAGHEPLAEYIAGMVAQRIKPKS